MKRQYHLYVIAAFLLSPVLIHANGKQLNTALRDLASALGELAVALGVPPSVVPPRGVVSPAQPPSSREQLMDELDKMLERTPRDRAPDLPRRSITIPAPVPPVRQEAPQPPRRSVLSRTPPSTPVRSDVQPLGVPESPQQMIDRIEALHQQFKQEVVPFDTFVEYAGLVNELSDLNVVDPKRIEHYIYVGADATLAYFKKRFSGLPRQELQLRLGGYMQEDEPPSFEDVLKLYTNLLDTYNENMNHYSHAASQLLTEYTNMLINLVFQRSVLYLLKFFDERTHVFQGYGLSNEPFRTEDFGEFSYATGLLRQLVTRVPGGTPQRRSLDVLYQTAVDWLPRLQAAQGVAPRPIADSGHLRAARAARQALMSSLHEFKRDEKVFLANREKVRQAIGAFADYTQNLNKLKRSPEPTFSLFYHQLCVQYPELCRATPAQGT